MSKKEEIAEKGVTAVERLVEKRQRDTEIYNLEKKKRKELSSRTRIEK